MAPSRCNIATVGIPAKEFISFLRHMKDDMGLKNNGYI
jgi:hypothetical protein